MNEARIDPVQLQMQAVNSLSRCKVMILANEPMYFYALADLERAQKAIAALIEHAASEAAAVH